MQLSAAALAREVRAGRRSARALCEDALAAAGADELGAFWHVDTRGATSGPTKDSASRRARRRHVMLFVLASAFGIWLGTAAPSVSPVAPALPPAGQEPATTPTAPTVPPQDDLAGGRS